MFVIDDAKLPPPTPASGGHEQERLNEVPGFIMSHSVSTVGISSTTR